mmetsp:Transcript_6834/g.26667  ORF Transcript_6834/g.26667 Transcript_6834/m.26667 type:complete len:307 (-) Transcript_6834:172-1092(-)
MFLNLLDPRVDLRIQRGDLRVPPDSLHEVMRRFVPARHVHQEVVAVRVRRVLPSPRPDHVVDLDGRRRIQAPRAHHLAQVHELGRLLLPVRALVEERSEPVVQRDQRGVLLVQEVVQSAVLPERRDEPRSGLEVQPEEPRELGFGFVPLRLVLDRDENLSLPVRVAHAFHLEPIHRLCIRGSLVGVPSDGLLGLLGGCGAVCGGRGRRRWVQPDFHAAHKLRKLRFGFRVVVTPRGAVGALVRRQHAPLHVQGPARILALRRVRLLPRVVHVYANRARVPRRALQRLVHLGFLPRQRRVHPALELL